MSNVRPRSVTQFLLVESAAPYGAFPDLVFENVEQDSFLASTASILFPSSTLRVWSVAPPEEEAGVLAYQARDALVEGKPFESTRLGLLLQRSVEQGHRFRLFYASDFSDLPTYGNRKTLFAALQEQLTTTDGASLELYAAWNGGT